MAKVNTKSSVSLATQIADALREKILAGRVAEGAKLPSEERLAQDYGVSRMTARQSLVELAAQGLIYRIPGKGTFVSGKNSSTENKGAPAGNLVMLAVPNLHNSFYYQIISGAEQALTGNGIGMLLRCANDDHLREKELLQKLPAMHVKGIIMVSGGYTKNNLEILDELRNKLPVVITDVGIPGLKIDTVISDDRKGGFLAAEHLIELGHTDIIHLAGPRGDSSADSRREGYAGALEKYGISPNTEYVRFTNWRTEEGYYETKKFFISSPLKERATAVFACNDEVAAGAYKALKELRISVPGEVALMGYGNMDAGEFLDVPLTTVDQSADEIGRTAGNLILNKIGGKRTHNAAEEVLIPTKLVIRNSCGIKGER
jgi:GntR family transcriptional regulator of arabinose operon